MSKLIYFTASFPYGIGENWKYTELEVLNRYFDEILVVPLADKGGQRKRSLPDSIRVLRALFKTDGQRFCKRDLLRLLNRRFIIHLIALFHIPASANFLKHIKQWAVDALKIERVLTDLYFQRSVLPELANSCLYFFWAKGYADILPFLPKELRECSVIRMHGFDLYWERHGGYIPYQAQIVRTARYLLTVSQHGASYLRKAYPDCRSKIVCSPLGTLSKGLASQSSDGVLRLISCAFVSDVKRLHLIPHALKYIDRDVEWTHIGSGDQLEQLIQLTQSIGVEKKVRFTGYMAADSIAEYYSSRMIDLYLNVSSSEGLPVSIMEALAASIPILATDVGGNSEIVDDNVGWLLPENLSAEILSENIEKFANLNDSVKKSMREACFHKYSEYYNAIDNAENLKNILLSV